MSLVCQTRHRWQPRLASAPNGEPDRHLARRRPQRHCTSRSSGADTAGPNSPARGGGGQREAWSWTPHASPGAPSAVRAPRGTSLTWDARQPAPLLTRNGHPPEGPRKYSAPTPRPQAAHRRVVCGRRQPITANGVSAGERRVWRLRRWSEECLGGTFNPRVVGSIPTGPTALVELIVMTIPTVAEVDGSVSGGRGYLSSIAVRPWVTKAHRSRSAGIVVLKSRQ